MECEGQVQATNDRGSTGRETRAIRDEALKELLEGYKKAEDLLGPDGLLPDVRKSHGPRRHIRKGAAVIVSSSEIRLHPKASSAPIDSRAAPARSDRLRLSARRGPLYQDRTASFNVDQIPPEVREALSSVLTTIEVVSTQILALDRRIRELGKKKYPETVVLRQVGGVGPIVALAYVLTLEHPSRFRKSRAVGPYLGLVPARSQSGDSDPQLRITKEGDSFLRRLLVQSAQYILGPFGPDCDLRRFG